MFCILNLSTEKGNWTQSPGPDQMGCSQLSTAENRKSRFLQQRDTERHQGRSHAQECWQTQNGLHGYVCDFSLFWFSFFNCCLFCFFLREKEYEIGWVGRWEGSGRNWGRGNNMIKIKLKLKNLHTWKNALCIIESEAIASVKCTVLSALKTSTHFSGVSF